jgi:hypothetical protein
VRRKPELERRRNGLWIQLRLRSPAVARNRGEVLRPIQLTGHPVANEPATWIEFGDVASVADRASQTQLEPAHCCLLQRRDNRIRQDPWQSSTQPFPEFHRACSCLRRPQRWPDCHQSLGWWSWWWIRQCLDWYLHSSEANHHWQQCPRYWRSRPWRLYPESSSYRRHSHFRSWLAICRRCCSASRQ